MRHFDIKKTSCVLLAGLMLITSVPAYTANAKEEKTTVQYHWKHKKGEVYCCVAGKRLKGLQTIQKKTYLFDKKNGRQRVGWQKISGDYYYFTIKPGKKGSMVRNKKVNHICLRKNGRAAVTKANKDRLWVLHRSQQMVENYTHTDYKTSVKMKQVWRTFQDNYTYHGTYDFTKRPKDWEVSLTKKTYERGEGGCYALGTSWAFLCNAIGVKECYAVSSGGHGWAEINGYVYDPSWDKTDKRNNYYHRSLALSGKNHSPNYKRAGIYRKRI